MADVGYVLTTHTHEKGEVDVLIGYHGYDNMDEQMQAIFVASGYDLCLF